MAVRRMFSKDIVFSDPFLVMPLSTQALYFQLGMAADDDGFLPSGRSIIRMIGAAEDDLKLLIIKRFIIPFDTGIIVIRHWKQNNELKSDRYHETIFLEEKSLLTLTKTKTYELETKCIQNVSNLVPQIRLEKISQESSSLAISEGTITTTIDSTTTLKINNYNKKILDENKISETEILKASLIAEKNYPDIATPLNRNERINTNLTAAALQLKDGKVVRPKGLLLDAVRNNYQL